MALFKNKMTSSGVQKGAPKKKLFFRFWEVFGDKFWKFFQINLIFTLFSLPLVTFGPALAAMTQVMRKFSIGEPIFIFDEFKSAFKKNFRQSFIVGVIDIGLIGIFLYNLMFYSAAVNEGFGSQNQVLLAVSLAIGIMIYMMHFYIYPQIVALNLRLPQIIKNSFILMIAGLKNSLAALFSTAFLFLLMYIGLPYSIVLIPLVPAAWVCFIATFCAYPVIRKFIIDPYYEAKGEVNPEYTRYETTEEETLFTDRGGFEEPTEINPKKNTPGTKVDKVKIKGKVIR